MQRSTSIKAPALLAIVAAALAGWTCTYSPNFADGVVACGPGDGCPQGYSCATDRTCRKHALAGAGGADGGGGAGGGGADGGSRSDTGGGADTGGGDPAGKFVGTWTFQSGTINVTCTDNSTFAGTLGAADFVVVARGATASSLLVEYFCDSGWKFGVGSSGTTATATAGQPTCMRSTTDQGVTTNFTWSVVTFTFNTSDGASGNLSGHLMGPFAASDNTSGNCDVSFMGSLAKTSP